MSGKGLQFDADGVGIFECISNHGEFQCEIVHDGIASIECRHAVCALHLLLSFRTKFMHTYNT